MMNILVIYLIIGIVLCVVKGDIGIYPDSFWGELLLSAVVIVMWLPIVVSIIIFGIITWLF